MARLSVISNSFLVVLKLAAGLTINSVSVISEAIHSGMDLIAALIALFAVSKSGKPPDAEHQYGHGKIENVSGVIEAILIFVAAVLILKEAAAKLVTGSQVATPFWGMIVMLFSAAVNWIVSFLLMKTARQTDSIALEADALHLRTDVYTSAGVAGGMLLLWVTDIQLFDPLLAIGVALLIIKTAYDLTIKAFYPLLDTSLPQEEEAQIREIIQGFEPKRVLNFHALRTRKSGDQRFIDLHLVVPQHYHIATTHQICDDIEGEIKDKFPGAQVLIHVDPCQIGKDCEGCGERGQCEILQNRMSEQGFTPSKKN